MSRILKSIILFGLCFFGAQKSGVAQQENAIQKQTKVYVQLKPNLIVPNALGNNFLSEAYDLNPGFMLEARLFFPNSYFLGLQSGFFESEVTDVSLVGDFERTNISHTYLTAGYAILPRNNKLGFDTALGLGYAGYANQKESIRFREDGFSLMANINSSYRLNPFLGVGVGLQFTKDFLATATAPELEKFFKNANTLYFSAGLVFYINQ